MLTKLYQIARAWHSVLMSRDDSQTQRTMAVALPVPLDGTYDYGVPDGEVFARGDLVEVSLGPRRVRGVVWGAGSDDVDPAKLKPIHARLDLPSLPRDLCDLIDWVAGYTLAPLGAVLRLAMAVPMKWETPKPRILYERTEDLPDRMTAARRKVLDFLTDAPALTKSELSELAGVSPSVIDGLAKQGALRTLEASALPAARPLTPVTEPDPLTEDQAAAVASLRTGLRDGGFSVSLVEGVTGSGKTHVYFEAAAEALNQGKQVLILLPEIALTAQFLARFEKRFGAPPVEWHSDLSQKDRQIAWHQVATGSARVVVGARSALFLPFDELGLIIVDEEHDPAFKQEDGVRYHARDMAIVRARLNDCPAVLASATPALESVVNAQTGRYRHLTLASRFGDAVLPDLHAIDLKEDGPEPGRFLSRTLIREAAQTISRGEQVLLFLNRRGYAPLTLCRHCGHRFECPECDAWLVEHRFKRELQCHHCGYHEPRPPRCPECGEEHLVAIGPGVERILEEISEALPDARTAVLSSDMLMADHARDRMTAAGPPKSLRALAHQRIHEFARGDFDLMIGTQIIAKGHHFPKLTLVGVVDADLGLAGGDLRAAERTYQLLTQVAGRAGREERSGKVLLQTYDPHHSVIAALTSGDAAAFRAAELEERKRIAMPPYGRLASLILTSRDRDLMERFARALAARAPQAPGLMVLGPAPAPLALIRGFHRMRFLIKAPLEMRLQPVLADWLATLKAPSALRIIVDMDPQSFA